MDSRPAFGRAIDFASPRIHSRLSKAKSVLKTFHQSGTDKNYLYSHRQQTNMPIKCASQMRSRFQLYIPVFHGGFSSLSMYKSLSGSKSWPISINAVCHALSCEGSRCQSLSRRCFQYYQKAASSIIHPLSIHVLAESTFAQK